MELMFVWGVKKLCDVAGCNGMVWWLDSGRRLNTGYVPWCLVGAGWSMVTFTVEEEL